jgi:hypothetical protein
VIWQNPWAWLGLAALALPVIIHLLGRGHARVQPFPTLRFLEASPLLPTRRTRVHDLVLLLVRLGILAAAVAALAQPLLLTAGRARSQGDALARAIVVDTSASMRRSTASGEHAIDAARREARRLAGEAQAVTTLETNAPSRALAGAVAWLGQQPSRGELVMVSDFQLGTVDSMDFANVPAGVGIRMLKVDVPPSAGPAETLSRANEVETVARISPSADRTDVEWLTSTGSARQPGVDLVMLTGASERDAIVAATHAAHTLAVALPVDTAKPVAIVYPQFEGRAALARGAAAPRAPWMTELVARLRGDSMLASVAAAAHDVTADTLGAGNGLVVARMEDGRPLIVALQGTVEGRERLLLISRANAGSIASATLISAVSRALSLAPPLAELDQATISESVLVTWQRPSAAYAPAHTGGPTTGDSDGRWLWLLVLILLALETWLRSESRAPSPESRAPISRA